MEYPPLSWSLGPDGTFLEAPAGAETLPVTNAAAVQLAALPDSAQAALITVEGADIRWGDEGGNLTAGSGHLATQGTVLRVTSRESLRALRFLANTAANATLQVSYYILRAASAEEIWALFPELP